MTKKIIVDELQQNIGGTKKDAERYLNETIKIIVSSLKRGETVSISGYGTFKVTKHSEHMGRNPKTGELIPVRASNRVRFNPINDELSENSKIKFTPVPGVKRAINQGNWA